MKRKNVEYLTHLAGGGGGGRCVLSERKWFQYNMPNKYLKLNKTSPLTIPTGHCLTERVPL